MSMLQELNIFCETGVDRDFKEALIKRLLELPDEIHKKAHVLFSSQRELQYAKETLANQEAELLLNGKIDGKNAEQRQAQLRQLTFGERAKVNEFEDLLLFAKIDLENLQNEFKALRSVAQIIGAEVM